MTLLFSKCISLPISLFCCSSSIQHSFLMHKFMCAILCLCKFSVFMVHILQFFFLLFNVLLVTLLCCTFFVYATKISTGRGNVMTLMYKCCMQLQRCTKYPKKNFSRVEKIETFFFVFVQMKGSLNGNCCCFWICCAADFK